MPATCYHPAATRALVLEKSFVTAIRYGGLVLRRILFTLAAQSARLPTIFTQHKSADASIRLFSDSAGPLTHHKSTLGYRPAPVIASPALENNRRRRRASSAEILFLPGPAAPQTGPSQVLPSNCTASRACRPFHACPQTTRRLHRQPSLTRAMRPPNEKRPSPTTTCRPLPTRSSPQPFETAHSRPPTHYTVSAHSRLLTPQLPTCKPHKPRKSSPAFTSHNPILTGPPPTTKAPTPASAYLPPLQNARCSAIPQPDHHPQQTTRLPPPPHRHHLRPEPDHPDKSISARQPLLPAKPLPPFFIPPSSDTTQPRSPKSPTFHAPRSRTPLPHHLEPHRLSSSARTRGPTLARSIPKNLGPKPPQHLETTPN